MDDCDALPSGKWWKGALGREYPSHKRKSLGLKNGLVQLRNRVVGGLKIAGKFAYSVLILAR